VDGSAEPLVCQRDLGGSIDPSVVVDAAGERWLLFKDDGNCCGLPTSIWSQRLTPDGLGVQGPMHELLTADAPWEGELIEGPSMVRDGDEYLLFYSANDWASEDYGIGWARCASPSGPCEKASDRAPWMTSTTFARGPGGQEFFDAVGERWMVYHGWAEDQAGQEGAQRRLFLDIVNVRDGQPQRVGGRRSWTTVAVVVLGVLVVAGSVVLVLRRRARRTNEDVGDELPLD
jgi:beta-xylosidase